MRAETSFRLKRDLIVVTAIIAGPTGRRGIRLVLDTGAAYTTLVPSIADSVGCTEATALKSTSIRTAVSEEHGYLVELTELSTLGVTVPDMQVNVADLGYGIERI